MRYTRRMKRMGRNKKKVAGLILTPLMDVFTILVFFLLFHSANGDVLETPKQIALPESVVEAKPRETVVIMISPDDVVVQGQPVVRTADLLDDSIGPASKISERLAVLERSIIGISTKTVIQNKEVTILADKSIPFRVLKKVMSICTGFGYGKISLAVIEKSPQDK